MSVQRIALLAGWVAVSLLAVAGFAAFTAPDAPTDTETRAIGSDLGRNAGAVSALSFTYLVDPGDAPATTVDLDAVVQEAILRRAGSTTTTLASSGETKDGSTFIRSDFMTEAAVRDLVAEYFEPSDVNRAVRLAWCLSSFNPESVNPATGDAGLFQHPRSEWDGWAASAGIPGADVFDAAANVQVAAWLLYEMPGGWTHWSCQA